LRLRCHALPQLREDHAGSAPRRVRTPCQCAASLPQSRNIENEGAIACVDIARHFVRHPIVTAYQERADGLVVLERHQPVRVFASRTAIAEVGKLPMPGRIRHLHRQLVGELALAVFRVARARNRPGFGILRTGDDADADAARSGRIGGKGCALGRRFRVLDGRGPSCRAA